MALLAKALEWSAQQDYKFVVAIGGMDALPAFNHWAGMLPLKVFPRCIIPDHLRGQLDATEGELIALASVINRVTL